MADNFEYPHCADVSKYEKLMKVGQGTFGEVHKAIHRRSRQLVALKKVLMENEKEGFPITSLREIRILKLLNHENIVNLIEICRTKVTPYNQKAVFYLVFEFCEHDLAGLLCNPQIRFSLGEIKKVLQMLLNALYFLHFNRILHRDMKAANILMTKTGILKLTDFGLARAIHPSVDGKKVRYTNRVVTLWYRPPELLLGERNYNAAIDMWGAGCIMAEMWARSPIMQGGTEQHQLNLISKLCGSISTTVWESVENLEYYNKMELAKNINRNVKGRLHSFVKDPLALDLIDNLLKLDPSKRLDADGALNHDFFWSDPMPIDLAPTLSRVTTSMFELHTPRRTGKKFNGGVLQNQQKENHPTKTNAAIYDRVF